MIPQWQVPDANLPVAVLSRGVLLAASEWRLLHGRCNAAAAKRTTPYHSSTRSLEESGPGA